jgi:hypothetical protein
MLYEEVKSLVRRNQEEALEERASLAAWVLAVELIEILKRIERKIPDPQKHVRSGKK